MFRRDMLDGRSGLATMKILVEFLNGPRDGDRLESDSDGPTLSDAEGVLRFIADQGLGARFWCPSEYALHVLRTYSAAAVIRAIAVGCRFPGHVYRVVSQEITADRARLRLIHAGVEE